MLAIVGASGKLAFATLNALLDHDLIPGNQIVCTTSSESGAAKLQNAQAQGATIRHATFDDESSMVEALKGCTAMFLVSSPRTEKDFHNAPRGKGRESDHSVALRAAASNSATLKTVYYSSLAFANPSKANVMRAHERTEQDIAQFGFQNHVIVREGLYSESWPLYLGHYDLPDDKRDEVPVAGDSQISWTSIPDLGLATALVLTDPVDKWSGKTFYLSQKATCSLEQVAAMVSKAKGKEVKLKIVSREEHERYYVQERGMDEGMVTWWSTTYDALRDEECKIDDPTLEDLLKRKGRTPQPMKETVAAMLQG